MDFIKPSARILNRYYRDPGKNLKLILSGELDKMSGAEERGAITRTVYGVARNQRLLDHVIQRFSDRKLSKIQTNILVLLRIGAYLLVYSSSYPDYAVVNEIINAAGAAGGKAKGFVNAVLRNIAKNKTVVPGFLENVESLEAAYSISNVLVDNLQLISSQLEADLAYLNREPLFHLRVNTKDFKYAEIRRLLAGHAIVSRELERFQSFEIKETGGVLRRLMQERSFYLQGTGSQVVSIIAARYARRVVLDCCAAPGAKSVTLSLLNPGLTIYANDINPGRVRLMKEFLDRYRFANIFAVVSDARRLGLRRETGIDFIIVDAPCTSSGTLRKNPDLKLKIDNERAAQNAGNQYDILTSVINCFSRSRASRYILYSVCSFIKEETEGVMEKLFRCFPGAERFRTVDLTGLLEEYGFNFKKGNSGCYLLPSDVLNNDIFYLSLLARRAVKSFTGFPKGHLAVRHKKYPRRQHFVRNIV